MSSNSSSSIWRGGDAEVPMKSMIYQRSEHWWSSNEAKRQRDSVTYFKIPRKDALGMVNNASRIAAAKTRARLTYQLIQKGEILPRQTKAVSELDQLFLEEMYDPYFKAYSSSAFYEMRIAATRIASHRAYNRMKTKSKQGEGDSQIPHIDDTNSRSYRRVMRIRLREFDEFIRLLRGSGLAERHLAQYPLGPLQILTESTLNSDTIGPEEFNNVIKELNRYVFSLRNSGLGDRFLMQYRMIRPCGDISFIPDSNYEAFQVSHNITRVIREVNRLNRAEVRIHKRHVQKRRSLMKKAQKHYVPTLHMPWFASVEQRPYCEQNLVPSNTPAVFKITTWVRIGYHWYKAMVDTSRKSKIPSELCSPIVKPSGNHDYPFREQDKALYTFSHFPKPSGKADLNMQIAPAGRCPALPSTQIEINPEVFDDPLDDSEDPEYPVILGKDVFMEEPVQVCSCYKHIAKSYGDCTVGRLHLLIEDPIRVEVELPDKPRAEDECMFLSQKPVWMDGCLYRDGC